MSERYELSEHLDAIRLLGQWELGIGEHVDAIERLLAYWWVEGYHNDSTRDTCRCGLIDGWEPAERLKKEERYATGNLWSEERALVIKASVTDADIDERIASYPIPGRSPEQRRESMRHERDEARAMVEAMGLPV